MIFLKKYTQTNRKNDKYDWWKNPMLDDEGTYDYFVEEVPESYCRWEFSKIAWEDDQGHPSHLRKVWCNYFHTMDGYDSCSGSDCWRCVLKDTIRILPRRIKRYFKDKTKPIKLFFEAFQMWYPHRSLRESIKRSIRFAKTFSKEI